MGPIIISNRSGGGGHHGSNGGSGSNPGGSGKGCLAVIAIFAAIIILLIVASWLLPSGLSNSDITYSTVEREPLPSGAVVETEYYSDNLDWVKNPTKLTAGLKEFYQQTGVQPYLYLTDTIADTHTPSAEQVEAFATSLYEELFRDEAHLLLIFFEYNQSYRIWYLCGAQAKTVLDQEAMDILLDNIERYYYDSSMDEDTFFSTAFAKAGQSIMTVYRSPWVTVWIVLGIAAVLAIVLLIVRAQQKRKREEAAETERILNTPLSTFGEDAASELEKKYQQPDTPTNKS